MTISPEDAQIILDFFHSKYSKIPLIKPSIKKFAAQVPECIKKYTVGEVLDLLTEHYP